jgi:hypothetical protein
MPNKITTASELEAKIAGLDNYFTLPILDVTIKYRRPDLLKLSLNNHLPSVMAAAVIESYKEAVGGADLQAYRESLKEKKIEADDKLIGDLSTKGYNLLKDLCVSHKILDVEQSDPANNLISWRDIPEEDAMSFLVHIINSTQKVQTRDGGEMSLEDITDFPEGVRKSKRSNAGANGKAVREAA